MFITRLIRPARFIELGMRSHWNETRVSPPHLVVPGQARIGMVRSVHTATYSEPSRAEPGLEG